MKKVIFRAGNLDVIEHESLFQIVLSDSGEIKASVHKLKFNDFVGHPKPQAEQDRLNISKIKELARTMLIMGYGGRYRAKRSAV